MKLISSWTGIMVAARMIEEQRLPHRATVFRRSEAHARYRNTLGPDGDWTDSPGLPAAIYHERRRPLSPKLEADFLSTQEALRSEMAVEWATELTRIENLARPLVSSEGWQRIDVMRAGEQEGMHGWLESLRAPTTAAIRDVLRVRLTRMSLLLARLGWPLVGSGGRQYRPSLGSTRSQGDSHRLAT